MKSKVPAGATQPNILTLVHDVFLSYAREDLEWAARIAAALETADVSVFWDRKIPPGQSFEDYLQRQLEQCSAVVVLWSPHSVTSKWVRLEASHGWDHDNLIPVVIRQADIPFRYRSVQASDLSSWELGQDSDEFKALLASIRALVPPRVVQVTSSLSEPSQIADVVPTVDSFPEAERLPSGANPGASTVPEGSLAPWRKLQSFVTRRSTLLAVLGLFVVAILVVLAIRSRSIIDPNTEVELARQTAETLVALVHARDFTQAYETFDDNLKKIVPFAQFRADSTRTLFQLPTNPLRHTLEQNDFSSGGFLFVFVTSEFSVSTSVRNVVTFTRVGTEWRASSYNWQPVEWPLAWPNNTEIRASAADAMKSYAALSSAEQSAPLPDAFQGDITGSNPGWKLVVVGTTTLKDPHRCGVSTTESGSSVVVTLNRVIGGCNLQPGQTILAHALLTGIDSSGIRLDGVRYYPAN